MPRKGLHPVSPAFETEALGSIDSLYRTALRLTHDRTDAEDLVQDTYLKAFRAAESFTPGGQPFVRPASAFARHRSLQPRVGQVKVASLEGRRLIRIRLDVAHSSVGRPCRRSRSFRCTVRR